LKAEIETLAFAFVRKNKLAVSKTLMRRLKTDVTAVEERYQGLLRRVQHKPFRSLAARSRRHGFIDRAYEGSKDQVKCKLS
jgi:hypothetical protein